MRNMQIIGNIGKITQKYTPTGKLITTASIATNTKVKGETFTTWVNAEFWEKSGEILQQYAKVGDKIYVSGSCNISAWQPTEGAPRVNIELTVKEFELLGGKPAAADHAPSAQFEPAATAEDDVPF